MLVIFSELLVDADDAAWIDRIRRIHDPHQTMVGPHLTLVFPFEGLAAGRVCDHVAAVAAASPILKVRLDRAAAVRDAFAPGAHVFLLPGRGGAGLRRLHRQLYAGVLAPKLDPLFAFRPHVTVAAFERLEDAERLAATLEPVLMDGRVDGLVVAEFDGRAVETLARFPFAS